MKEKESHDVALRCKRRRGKRNRKCSSAGMNKNQGIELDESSFNTGNGGDDNIPLWQLDISCNQQDHREYMLRQ